MVQLSEQPRPLNYNIVSQTVDQLRNPENSPSISMWRHLVESEQMPMVNILSIYAERGDTPERARIFYMNDPALQLWNAMGQQTDAIGKVYRPPKSAQLIFGSPFSE